MSFENGDIWLAPECNLGEFSAKTGGYAFGNTSFAHSWRPHQQNRPSLQMADQFANRYKFQYSQFHVLKAVMVLVQYYTGEIQVKFILFFIIIYKVYIRWLVEREFHY